MSKGCKIKRITWNGKSNKRKKRKAAYKTHKFLYEQAAMAMDVSCTKKLNNPDFYYENDRYR